MGFDSAEMEREEWQNIAVSGGNIVLIVHETGIKSGQRDADMGQETRPEKH